MNTDPDLELVKQCLSKDPTVYEGAFKRIYEKYGDRAYNISYRILGNAEDALDVTQDAFVILFKKIEKFKQNSRFFTWFYRIVVNLSIDRKRKLASIPSTMDTDSGKGSLSEVPDSRADAIEELEQEEHLEKKIQASFMKLSPNLRTVTVLRYIEGLSYLEIAETLECSIGTVKSRLNRAHKTLESILKPMLDLSRNQGKPD